MITCLRIIAVAKNRGFSAHFLANSSIFYAVKTWSGYLSSEEYLIAYEGLGVCVGGGQSEQEAYTLHTLVKCIIYQ